MLDGTGETVRGQLLVLGGSNYYRKRKKTVLVEIVFPEIECACG
jgi:hypothetical protein